MFEKRIVLLITYIFPLVLYSIITIDNWRDTMNYGVIDIGSNTVRLGIYELVDDKIKQFFMKKETPGLISYVDGDILNQRGILKLLDSLKSLLEITNKLSIDGLYVFSTAVLRRVSNSQELIDFIREELAIEIDLISQEEEARLGLKGILESPRAVNYKRSGITADIGGGSTEIVIYKDGLPEKLINISKGSLLLYKTYVKEILASPDEADRISRDIEEDLAASQLDRSFEDLIGIGGSIIASKYVIDALFSKKDRDFFTYEELDIFIENILARDKNTLDLILQLAPERIHTLLPGSLVLREICRCFNIKRVFPETHGLKEGYLLNKLSI